MGSPEYTPDEPLTPAGRLFLQPEMNTIIHGIIRGKNSIDIDAVKATLKSSAMLQHPRFCSLLVRDAKGFEHWRRTQVDIDQHVFIINRGVKAEDDIDDDDEAGLNRYLADLSVSSPLNTEKPLWELHILMAHKCCVIRVHHALGDGISLMSMLLALCRRADDPDAPPTMVPRRAAVSGKAQKGGWDWKRWLGVLWRLLKVIWFSLVFALEFVLRALWIRDSKTVITGGAGVELWPRKLATAKFLLDDMKVVKRAIANATINDVLFAVVSSGLSRYLHHRSPNALQEGLRLTGVAMVNLRQQTGLQDLSNLRRSNSGSGWGNKFGMILLPVYYHKGGGDPLQYLKTAKAMVDRKKHSLEAHLSYKIGNFVMSWLGAKYASLLNYRLVCNTTFTISNVVGPQEEITIAGNPVSYIRVNTSSLPHALTMHMVSYAGRADMQLLVAKDIIPDPEFLAKCFEDALLEMKESAMATS